MLQLVHHSHSGRRVAHHHTSYPSLFVITLLAALVMLGMSAGAGASTDGSGGETVYATVPSARPTSAPTVGAASSASQLPFAVSGRCESGTLVKAFSNGVLIGAGLCVGGKYSLSVDLFQGANTVTAQAFNALDEASPASSPIAVTYTPPGANATAGNFAISNTAAGQFFMTSNLTHQGFYPNQQTNWQIQVNGGTPPYAVSVGWGDNLTDVYSQAEPGALTINHSYDKSAPTNRGYTIIVKATDAAGNHAYLPLVAIVNDASSPAKPKTITQAQLNLAIAWPILAAVATLMLGFWLGEVREKEVLQPRTA